MSLAALFVELWQDPAKMNAFLADPRQFVEEMDNLSEEDKAFLRQLDPEESLRQLEAASLASVQETSAVYVLTYASHRQPTDEVSAHHVTHRDGVTTLERMELDLLAAHETVQIVAWGTWDVNTGNVEMTIIQPKKDNEEWIMYELKREGCNNLTHIDGVTHLSKTRVHPMNEEADIGKKYYLSGSMSTQTGRVVLTFGIDKVKKDLQDDIIM